jgi:hypothetical protein
MNFRPLGFAFLASLLLSYAPAIADSAFTPRHVVYSFTYGNQTDLEVHSSGIDAGGNASGGSGMSDYTGGESDQGTIEVDVLSEQPDKGLVVKVSEHAQKTRSSPAATCVVYGTTGVICDPHATINSEEMSLIRLLGPTFVDPNKIDAKQHWQIADTNSAYSLTSDFTISKNVNGVMTIDENRTIKQQQPTIETTEVTTTIGYDLSRTLPTSVREYTIERNEAGMGQHNTTKTETVLVLKSDSPATP